MSARSSIGLSSILMLLASFYLIPLSHASDLTLLQDFRADHMILCAEASGDRLYLGTQSGKVQVWNWRQNHAEPDLLSLASGGEMEEIVLGYPIRSIAFSPDQKTCAVAASDALIHIFSYSTSWQETSTIPGMNPMQVCFLDNEHILVGQMGGELGLLEVAMGLMLYNRQLEYDPVSTLALSPDGTQLAVAFTSSKIQLIAPRSGEELAILKGHLDYVFSVVWSPDGSRLYTAGKDRRILCWDPTMTDLPPEEIYHDERYIYALACAPDRDLLALSLLASGVGLLEPRGAREPIPHEGHTAPISVLGFLDEGKLLFSAGNDARLMIWRVE
jgi:WD40 repeat protein